MNAGYTHCACYDCFEIVVSADMSNPDLCSECEDHCDGDGECCRPLDHSEVLEPV